MDQCASVAVTYMCSSFGPSALLIYLIPVSSVVVLEIMIGHRTFSNTKLDACLNSFDFDWTKCPNKN